MNTLNNINSDADLDRPVVGDGSIPASTTTKLTGKIPVFKERLYFKIKDGEYTQIEPSKEKTPDQCEEEADIVCNTNKSILFKNRNGELNDLRLLSNLRKL